MSDYPFTLLYTQTCFVLLVSFSAGLMKELELKKRKLEMVCIILKVMFSDSLIEGSSVKLSPPVIANILFVTGATGTLSD